ncbi:MAG TPA: hypothetical protein VIY72_12235 [Acidimicrobiales bacterium]
MKRLMGADEPDVVIELDELGSLVLDLRAVYERAPDPDVAARHLALMDQAAREAALSASGPAGTETSEPD